MHCAKLQAVGCWAVVKLSDKCLERQNRGHPTQVSTETLNIYHSFLWRSPIYHLVLSRAHRKYQDKHPRTF